MKESPCLVEKASTQIADMIFRYQLPPGSKVSDYTLAKKLGISRTPIRQAIMMLVKTGLIVEARDGFRVVEVSISKIDELYDARVCIETTVLAFAIEKGILEEDLEVLGELLERKREAFESGDILRGLDYDMEYHRLIVALAHNRSLDAAFTSIYTYMKLINVLSLVNPNKETNSEYTRIYNAIIDRDSEKACGILRQSIELGRRQKKEAIGKFEGGSREVLYNFIAASFPHPN